MFCLKVCVVTGTEERPCSGTMLVRGTSTPWRACIVLVSVYVARTSAAGALITAAARDAFVSTSSATTHTTHTTSTTTPTGTFGCVDVEACLGDTRCSECLLALNASYGSIHSNTEFNKLDKAALAENQVSFFHTLLSTASCSTSLASPGILLPALQDLNEMSFCVETYGMAVDGCLVYEYTCFVDPDCRQCLAALHAVRNDHDIGHNTKAEAFGSPACNATDEGTLMRLMDFCGASFPMCSYDKHSCVSSPECAPCLATLRAGDGAGAARQCRGKRASAYTLDHLVTSCFDSNAVACSFWSQRCANNANCSACSAVMGNGDDVVAIATDFSAPACQRAAQDDLAVNYLFSIATGCPDVSVCRSVVTVCVFRLGEDCIVCLNGSASPAQAAFCSNLMHVFSFDKQCRPCPESVHTINAVVFATATVGGASAVACIAIAITILAHGRDRVSMRDRIVVGLMLANTVYSTANTIPLNALRTDVLECGRLAMPFGVVRFGRAWWFGGKYGLVGFELFILGASIRAMIRGVTVVPPRAEAAMHVACCTLGILAFVVFYVRCTNIIVNGYNEGVESEVYSNSYSHASTTDDLDDDKPSTRASSAFQRGRNDYNALVKNMLLVWDVLVGLAVGLWAVLRILHVRALRALGNEAAAATHAEATDVWVDTRRSVWEAKRRFLELQREAFTEVAKPLEPYIAVFVVFAAPAFVMSTSFCQRHSGASAASAALVSSVGGSSNVTYGTCNVWCEFVLSFRSMGTIFVYLLRRERRAELVAVRTTWRKVCRRVVGCFRGTSMPYARLGSAHGEELAMHVLARQHPADYDSGVGTPAASTTVSWHINESDAIKEKVLGKGAFGEVWAGRLMPENIPVAIKVLFAGAIDAEGDPVNPRAHEDFCKECAALQSVDSPRLVQFFGFGTTSEGNGFIVTELLGGGCLQDVLRESEFNLPWRLRIKIGLHVALGMEHLHKMHLLHRDLKSANVLLDEQRTQAKVCDFGLARVLRPPRQPHVVYSPFTGTTKVLPRLEGVDLSLGDGGDFSALSMTSLGVTIVDAQGIMTKAAGTMLWMAPEVFRGDRNYTRAVDVYSFGIVLWELATRKTPWTDEFLTKTLTKTALFEELNQALQTGRRPYIPDRVRTEHAAFVALMQQCWAGDPADRPTFSQAAADLAACLRSCIDS